MAPQQALKSVDIHDLIQKLSDFKCSILSQRVVDAELSLTIAKQLTDFHVVLSQFSKNSDELLRLLHCCFDFLSEGIGGKKL